MSSLGTELKINVHIEGMGDYKMSDVDFFCEFYVFFDKKIKVTKQEMIKVDDENYLACIDTTSLGIGRIMCRVTAYIPDSDFKDGLRTEVETVYTNIKITR